MVENMFMKKCTKKKCGFIYSRSGDIRSDICAVITDDRVCGEDSGNI